MYRLLVIPAGFFLLFLMWGPIVIASILDERKSKRIDEWDSNVEAEIDRAADRFYSGK